MKKTNNLCPCGSNVSFDDCCKKYISGQNIVSTDPELLLRSRFSAYTMKEADYIYTSWHENYRPKESKEDFISSLKGIKFTKLVVEEKLISLNKATITYIVFFKKITKLCQIHEKANFIFENGRWFYTDGIMLQ